MEVEIRSHHTRRPGGGEVLVHEWWEMVDHSALRTGTDMVPGGRRYALAGNDEVRRLDEVTFQVVATGEILRLILR